MQHLYCEFVGGDWDWGITASLKGISAAMALPSSYQPTLDKQIHHHDICNAFCSSLSAGRSVWKVSYSSALPPSGPRPRSSGCPQCRLHLQKKKKQCHNSPTPMFQNYFATFYSAEYIISKSPEVTDFSHEQKADKLYSKRTVRCAGKN